MDLNKLFERWSQYTLTTHYQLLKIQMIDIFLGVLVGVMLCVFVIVCLAM